MSTPQRSLPLLKHARHVVAHLGARIDALQHNLVAPNVPKVLALHGDDANGEPWRTKKTKFNKTKQNI